MSSVAVPPMVRTAALSLGLAAIALALACGVTQAGPAMTTFWQPTSLELTDCVQRGEAAIREAGMTENFQTFRESIYGERGPYTAAIRCLSGKGVVFFAVSGPRPDRASALMAVLRAKFEPEQPPG